MALYKDGKKIEQLYKNGKKIKNIYQNGKKIYSFIDNPPEKEPIAVGYNLYSTYEQPLISFNNQGHNGSIQAFFGTQCAVISEEGSEGPTEYSKLSVNFDVDGTLIKSTLDLRFDQYYNGQLESFEILNGPFKAVLEVVDAVISCRWNELYCIEKLDIKISIYLYDN